MSPLLFDYGVSVHGRDIVKAALLGLIIMLLYIGLGPTDGPDDPTRPMFS